LLSHTPSFSTRCVERRDRRSGYRQVVDGAHSPVGTGALADVAVGQAFFADPDNDLIDLDRTVIVDVEPSTAIRQAEVTASKTMIERTEKRFGL
jgi:hypothetical protein